MWLHDVKQFSSTLILHYVTIKENNFVIKVCSLLRENRCCTYWFDIHEIWNFTSDLFVRMLYQPSFLCVKKKKKTNKTYLQSEIINCTMIDILLNEGFKQVNRFTCE